MFILFLPRLSQNLHTQPQYLLACSFLHTQTVYEPREVLSNHQSPNITLSSWRHSWLHLSMNWHLFFFVSPLVHGEVWVLIYPRFYGWITYTVTHVDLLHKKQRKIWVLRNIYFEYLKLNAVHPVLHCLIPILFNIKHKQYTAVDTPVWLVPGNTVCTDRHKSIRTRNLRRLLPIFKSEHE